MIRERVNIRNAINSRLFFPPSPSETISSSTSSSLISFPPPPLHTPPITLPTSPPSFPTASPHPPILNILHPPLRSHPPPPPPPPSPPPPFLLFPTLPTNILLHINLRLPLFLFLLHLPPPHFSEVHPNSL